MAGTGVIVGYNRWKYARVVDEVYDLFTQRLQREYGKKGVLPSEDETMFKNFSNSRFNLDEADEEDIEAPTMNPFAGGAEADGRSKRRSILAHFYG